MSNKMKTAPANLVSMPATKEELEKRILEEDDYELLHQSMLKLAAQAGLKPRVDERKEDDE